MAADEAGRNGVEPYRGTGEQDIICVDDPCNVPSRKKPHEDGGHTQTEQSIDSDSNIPTVILIGDGEKGWQRAGHVSLESQMRADQICKDRSAEAEAYHCAPTAARALTS